MYVCKCQHSLVCQRTCVMKYVDQQTLKPDDDYSPLHQHLWTDAPGSPGYPLSVTRAFPVATAHLWNSLPSHVTAAPSPSSALVLSHISSHFLVPLSDSSFICTVSTQWLIILDTILVFVTLFSGTDNPTCKRQLLLITAALISCVCWALLFTLWTLKLFLSDTITMTFCCYHC